MSKPPAKHNDKRQPRESRSHKESKQDDHNLKRRKDEESNNVGKKILKIKHRDLFAQIDNIVNTNQMDQKKGSTSPTQSPTNQNLSYHQQQQLHHQQIQRTGGLQRLTADLAGLQFHDADALVKLPPRPKNKAASPIIRQIHSIHGSKSSKYARTEGQQNEELAKNTLIGAYDDQMILSKDNSQGGAEFDAARDAQETADDASILRRYKFIQLVGTGNYARVYKAITPTGKEVAIKAINLSKTSDNYKQKFLPRELTILKKIQHPNICRVREILHVADRVFIVMQFCQKGTIADLLHKMGSLSEPVARNLILQTVDAVIYLHSIDLAHRDLKVENILLDEEYCPKLTDFSYSIYTVSSRARRASSDKLGQIRSCSKLNETFCGTLPYLSPEMIRQYPYDAKKTDIWSLGVCLYVMLNDRLPFPFTDIKLMVRKQLTKDYKFKANIEFSEQAKNLVSQMLEPDYTKRLSCVEVSRHPWMNGSRERPHTDK